MLPSMFDQVPLSNEPQVLPDEPSTLLFDAVLHPHRSLGPTGFLVLMGVVVAVSFVAGAVFFVVGAWPIPAFFGLDVLLVYIAFRANYRSARVSETVQLSRSELVVRRTQPNGAQQEWRFQPYWLRVNMDDPPRHDSRLMLSSHGRHVSIGGFLTPDERLEVAEALRAALAAGARSM
jgi:uncharacterized membrane protein